MTTFIQCPLHGNDLTSTRLENSNLNLNLRKEQHIPSDSLTHHINLLLYFKMDGIAAAKRLRKELQNLERATAKNDPDDYDIYLRPTSPCSILKWTALLRGPPDTPYENGIFQVSIRCNSVRSYCM